MAIHTPPAPLSQDDAQAPGDLPQRVLEILERLDEARTCAMQVLEQVFFRLASHRYPIGAVVNIADVTVYDDIDGATQAKITRHLKPDISIEKPEMSQLVIECAALRRDGSSRAMPLFSVNRCSVEATGPRMRSRHHARSSFS